MAPKRLAAAMGAAFVCLLPPIIAGSPHVASSGASERGAPAVSEAAQRRDRRDAGGGAENLSYDGRFVFTRIRYRSAWGGWGFRGSWAHDYPRADRHLPRILDELTTVDVNAGGSDVYDLGDPAIFTRPLIYISEPGFWGMTDDEAARLREYVRKGGFIIFDDFEAEQWRNFEAQMRRVVPECRPIEIGVDHPIFHSFFDLKTIDFPHPLVDVSPRYFGYFEDNDPAGRMLAIVNYNNDIAEYWEWSDTGLFPMAFTNEAYKLGVNYIVYAMTH